MRINDILGALLLLRTAVAEPAPFPIEGLKQFSPFVPPSRRSKPLFLFKRQSCPADYSSCANLGAPESCCPSGTNCARDVANNVACCPLNNYCTGNIGQTGIPGSSTTQTGIPTGYIGTVTVISTAGVTGPVQTGVATATGNVAGGGSTVPNNYYPFVYLPTSFGNAAICSQYYTSCQAASTACFQSLGGINGVTIGGMGGGTTQVGVTGVMQVSASSICSSLSQSACYGLQTTQCAQFGSAGATGTGFIQAGAGPRETGHPAMAYLAAAGAAIGAMGMAV